MIVLKLLRNAVADSAAAVAYHLPPVEPLFRAVGRAIEPIPQVGTLYRRGIDTLVARLTISGQHFRRLTIGDVSFLFDVSDFTSRPWFFHGRLFEPETTRRLLETLQAGQTVLDVGANRGYVTLIAALKVGPAGRVHSFEPNPQVRAELAAHVQMNGVADRATICSDALSDRSDQDATFFVSTFDRNSGLSSLTPSRELLELRMLSPEHTITVRTNTLDRYAEQQGLIAPIDLIKIDVEGAELMVLHGAERTLRERPPRRWIVETEPGSEACRLLASHGYREEHLDPAGDKVNAVFTHPSAK
ncbi:MAG TPA: FkbM family methyltransferase [Planctomycetaceae bacterium]|nr:FkbM family methyltransferase [Planctomycetaceae bacterium]